jgi:hypothetical protein
LLQACFPRKVGGPQACPHNPNSFHWLNQWGSFVLIFTIRSIGWPIEDALWAGDWGFSEAQSLETLDVSNPPSLAFAGLKNAFGAVDGPILWETGDHLVKTDARQISACGPLGENWLGALHCTGDQTRGIQGVPGCIGHDSCLWCCGWSHSVGNGGPLGENWRNLKALSAVTKYLSVLMSLNLLIQSLSFLECKYDLISFVPPWAVKETYWNRPRKLPAAMTLRQYIIWFVNIVGPCIVSSMLLEFLMAVLSLIDVAGYNLSHPLFMVGGMDSKPRMNRLLEGPRAWCVPMTVHCCIKWQWWVSNNKHNNMHCFTTTTTTNARISIV